jgi:hypothetical protein
VGVYAERYRFLCSCGKETASATSKLATAELLS